MLRTQLKFRMLVALAVTACAAIFSSAASAGTYTVDSCTKSATHALGAWGYDETSGTSNGAPYFWTAKDCSSYGVKRRWSYAIPAGAYSAYTYDAPAGTFIESVDIWQSATPRVSGAYDSVYAVLADGTRETVGLATGSAGTTLGNTSYTMPHPTRTTHLRSELGCAAGGTCSGTNSNGAYGNEYALAGTIMHLNDPNMPAVTATGSGWSTAPADGVDSIDYAATDSGSGVSAVRFFLDGAEVAAAPQACTAGTNVPCPVSATGSFVLDTTQLSEGAHTISLVAADYSGNTMSQTDKQLNITVRRAPAPTSGTPVSTSNPSWNGGGSPAVGDHLQGNAGGWSGDGNTYSYQWMRCDASGQNCVPIDGATGLSYTPTSQDVGSALVFCVTATNSGGSATSCSAPTPAVVASHPATGGGSTGSNGDATGANADGGSAVAVVQPSGSKPSSGSRGQANGSPASDRVVLSALANSRSLSQKVKFGKRVPISGRLVDPSGTPIAGATLSVQTQTAIPGASMADASKVVTGSDGRFTYVAPAGPSRTVRFGYRSFSGDTSFADTTDVHLMVTAGVTMKAKPKKVHNRHATVFTGRLLGRPIPRRGVIVDLQVFYRHQWRTFAAPRTKPNGTYRFKYRFMAGAATWKFRARVRHETSYPYIEGYSRKPVKVRVLP